MKEIRTRQVRSFCWELHEIQRGGVFLGPFVVEGILVGVRVIAGVPDKGDHWAFDVNDNRGRRLHRAVLRSGLATVVNDRVDLAMKCVNLMGDKEYWLRAHNLTWPHKESPFGVRIELDIEVEVVEQVFDGWSDDPLECLG